jgi:hypothetical protein
MVHRDAPGLVPSTSQNLLAEHIKVSAVPFLERRPEGMSVLGAHQHGRCETNDGAQSRAGQRQATLMIERAK